MQVEIRINESCPEPKIIIETAAITDEISVIVKKLSENPFQIIAGVKDQQVEVLDPKDIIRAYANDGKVCVVTERGECAVRLRLYEMEEKLESNGFVRISNSELVNLKKVESFDLSLSGTMCVRMANGDVTFVSRRYVRKIKQILGL